MTFSYTAKVATGAHGLGNFWKLLFHWRASIYKLVSLDLIVYMLMYYIINIPYRLFLANQPGSHHGRIYFHAFVKYARDASGLIPLQFILGFYVSQVITRWWEQYMTTPWPDTIAVTVACSLHGHDDRGRLMRRTIVRYVNLSFAMVLSMVSPPARARFPSLDTLVEVGLLVPHESLILDHLNERTPGPKYYVPIVWAGAVAVKARKEGRIKDDIALYNILKVLCKFRATAGDILSYDWVNIPLVYTQVATLATYVYFFSCLFAKQMLNDPDEVDIYVPVFLILEFVFMLGWLKVAETLINPFGYDDDDFEVNWLIDRHITVCYQIVDEMNNEFPEMLKDIFWEGKIPEELMYTEESLKFKTDGMGGGSAAIQEEQMKEKETQNQLSVNTTPSTSEHRRFSPFHLRKVRKHSEHDEELGVKLASPKSSQYFEQFMEHGKAPEYKDSDERLQEEEEAKARANSESNLTPDSKSATKRSSKATSFYAD